MVQPTVYKKIRIKYDADKLIESLKVATKPGLIKKLVDMILVTEQIARPKAIILPVTPQFNDKRSVVVNDLEFQSGILKINLEKASSVFAVVVTAGWELQEWTTTIDDILFQYWADFLAGEVLQQTASYVDNEIKSWCNKDFVSWMTPGSLEDWPINQQEKLFALFEGQNRKIGVDLTENYIMLPLKSLSGFVFSSEEPFFTCQLCEKVKCIKRRAMFDEIQAAEQYGIKRGMAG